jgi:hypothetical protein
VLVVVAPLSTIVQASAAPPGGVTSDQTSGEVNLRDL